MLITKMSAVSNSPALLAWMESPHLGLTTTTVVSVAEATSTSTWPTPTVSTRTRGMPAAANSRMASGTARASPPRWPREAMERMKTPVSRSWPCIRTRSPRMAPPENGDVGSMASTASWATPAPRAAVIRRSVRVDFPAPGAPVMPTVSASVPCR